jgi:hypothetical protein
VNSPILKFLQAAAAILSLAAYRTSVAAAPAAIAPTGANVFTVGNNAFDHWTLDGQNDPTITLTRGQTYTFDLVAVPSFHPFFIKTVNSTGSANQFNDGVTGNGATEDGNVVFTVPVAAPAQLFYNCGNHAAMAGVINIIDAPPETTIFANGFEN